MTVYYFQRKLDCAIKIGFTDRPVERRKHEIETALGATLDLIGSEPGSRTLERARHEQFGHLRTLGEWFQPSDDLYAFLVTLPGSPVLFHPGWGDFHDRLINELFLLFHDSGVPIRYSLLAEIIRNAAEGEKA